MRWMIWTGCFLALLGQPADAGAWLREKGKAFLANSVTLTRGGGQVLGYGSAVYAEYGAFEKLTLGLDLHMTGTMAGHVRLFGRVPLGRGDRPYRLAAELALGAVNAGTGWDPAWRAAIGYGRGLGQDGSGWLSVDFGVEDSGAGPFMVKLDATIGLPGQSRIRPMVQIETAHDRLSGFSWGVIPQAIIPTKKGKSRWVVGAELRSGARYGLKLGLWRDF